jgi:ribonuclease HIII
MIEQTDRIGTDESGKGDYFGYLVVAGVFADVQARQSLARLGVRDSKRMSDSVALRLGRGIRRDYECQVVRISPAKYNQLHDKMGNVNLILAWAHARVIEDLLARVHCGLVVSDQFGDESYLRESLMREGKRVRLVQVPRAEADVVVAAASVVARCVFLETLETISRRAGMDLPKGATHVLPAARAVLEKGGRDLLGQVAKLHFRTTRQLDTPP